MNTKTFMFFIILVTTWKNAHSTVDCNKQNFLCNSTTTFYDCVDDGNNNTFTDPTSFPLNTCATGTICDKNQPSPCASFTPLPTTVKATTNTTIKPTVKPTFNTTVKPTVNTTIKPTVKPTVNTTIKPTVNTTIKPTVNTTVKPTVNTTIKPTVNTTVKPTVNTTVKPTVNTTIKPTVKPTVNTTIKPTVNTTIKPTVNTTVKPTVNTTIKPTVKPTVNSTVKPTVNTTVKPTVNTTVKPTVNTTIKPTVKPTVNTTIKPTVNTTVKPTVNTTVKPTVNTTIKPTVKPTVNTTIKPTGNTTVKPTVKPPVNATVKPTVKPTVKTTVKPVVIGWNFNCTIAGRFPSTRRIDCKEYVICSLNLLGKFIANYYSCPNMTIFSPSSLKCTLASLIACTPVTTTTPRVTLHPPICKGNGRCSNPFVADCKGYVISTTDSKGNHIEAYYLCPPPSIFNPLTMKCTIPPFYICPSKVTTVKPTTRRVTIKPTTRRVTTTTKRPTRCTAVGKISDPSVANCKGYILCSRDVSGNFVEAKFNCPLFSVFDPLNKICSILYKCTPSCTKAGRFADPSVPGCKGYTLCSQFLLVFIQTKYTCASTTVFSPLTKICTLSSVYTCPN